MCLLCRALLVSHAATSCGVLSAPYSLGPIPSLQPCLSLQGLEGGASLGKGGKAGGDCHFHSLAWLKEHSSGRNRAGKRKGKWVVFPGLRRALPRGRGLLEPAAACDLCLGGSSSKQILWLHASTPTFRACSWNPELPVVVSNTPVCASLPRTRCTPS